MSKQNIEPMDRKYVRYTGEFDCDHCGKENLAEFWVKVELGFNHG